MRYLDFEASREVPNLVVDGSANEATVLTLSHWPGAVAPPGLARDLSAEMAFAYLDRPPDHRPADVVTNNHFDQDGLVAMFALIEPDRANAHRELLVDVAAAGDFGTYRHRDAARASMALAALASDESDDCSYSVVTDRLYTELLPRLVEIATKPERFQDLWADEDARLSASERAIEAGSVTIDEDATLDLAIVTIDAAEPARRGHRFGHAGFDAIHPMALHNATERFRLLVVHGRRYRYIDRYETWVQYQSRPTLPRVDLRPLADELTALETGPASWSAGAPSDLTPELTHTDESSIDAERFVERVRGHLDGRCIRA